MATLSVLYIVRNEEDTIKKSLESIQAIADEIIIVDTGSRDKTLQVCRQFRKVKIYSHNWIHDFSAVRNYGLRQCTKAWTLCLDGDEMLDPRGASAAKAAIDHARSNVAGFAFHIADHEQAMDTNSPINPTSHFPSPQIRLFRRHGAIQFQGKVQESVRNTILKVGAVDLLDVPIHHFLWRGRGAEFGAARTRYYTKLGAPMNQPMEMPRQIVPPPPDVSTPHANQVAIVVPAFNVLNATKECLTAIQQNTQTSYSLFLVDNGSVDGTAEYMQGILGRAPTRFKNNLGPAKAKNAAARECLQNPAFNYICFLDNDTKPTPGWLERMISVFESDPSIGLVGPLSNGADGTQFARTESFENREPAYIFTNSVNGFCMLTSTAVVRRIGLFDESFGLYGCEDRDFCERVKQAGFQIAVANKVYVEHRNKATVTENKMDWRTMHANSAAKFSAKWKNAPVAPTKSPERRGSYPMATPPTGFPKFSIVILTHNRLDVTQECINSILRHTADFELIIVDNASSDGTVEWLNNRVPNAKIIRNEKNLGVPIARNQGIRETTTDYVIMMDNDVVVKDGWFRDLFNAMNQQKADIVGLEGWQIDVSYQACHKCVNKTERFDYLGGACNLFKRKVFEDIGLLDEGFSPAYYEDVDICIRAKNAGYKLAWVPGINVQHREHATLVHGQKTFAYQEALSKSHARFAKKMRREITVTHEKLSPPVKKLKMLYLGMYYDYGIPERGLSFEQCNFYPAVKQWSEVGDFRHFDFVQLGKQHGIPKMSNMLLDEVYKFGPDVLFAVFFDQNHDPDRNIIKQIGTATPCKTVGWFCDSHFRYDNFDRPWADALQYNVTTSASAYQRYLQDGLAMKVIKSQWGAAPSYKKLDIPRDVNCSFVGQPHGDRQTVVNEIRKAGIDLQTYGTGWPTRLSFEGVVQMFNKSKINLNLNNACDVRFKQIKGRNFEVPACGGFLLSGVAENLGEYYEIGKEIVTFDSTPDMIEKIKYYLAHDEEREAIALAGYERTMRDHTYQTRFNHIFRKIGVI